MKLLELKSLVKLLVLVVACTIGTGCQSLYVDRDSRTVTINTNPQGAYVWSIGKKLLGQTPMQFTKDAKDDTTHMLLITQNGFHSETIMVYDEYDNGEGFLTLDSLLILPGFFDCFFSIGYGKYKDTNFNVNMISTSIPCPDAEANAYAQQQAAEAIAYAQRQAAQAQAMADAANAISNGINQAAQQIQNSQQCQPPPSAPRQTPAAPSQTVAPRPVTPVPKPNFKRWCAKHGEWDARFSAGCPACRAPKFAQ